MHTLWFEGADHGLVWSHGMALVSGEVATRAVTDIWSEFDEAGDLASFLRLLSLHTGTDVLSLPDFAIVLRTARGAWQLAARGRFVAQIDQEIVQGAGITTWAERSISGGSAAAVGRVGDSVDGRPLVAGVGAVSGLVWGEVPHPEAAGPVVDEVEHQGEPLPVASVAMVGPVPSTVGAESSVPLTGVAAVGVDEPPVSAPDDSLELPDWAVALLGEASGSVPAAHQLDQDVADPEEPGGEPEPDAEEYTLDPALEEPESAPPLQEETLLPQQDELVEVPAAPATQGSPGRFSRQYGDTELFSIEDAAVRDGEEDFIDGVPDPDGSSPARRVAAGGLHQKQGDHDGHTMLASDLARGSDAAEADADDEGPSFAAVEGPSVLAVRCAEGHINPPHRSVCYECGAPLSEPAAQLPRPVLGRLLLPGGDAIELNTPVIIGRNPRVERYQGSVLPQLVPLPQGHVSSNHVELRLEEWNVLAQDLHSTNGTYLRRRGEAPVRLGERPELLMDGDVLDLGHGVQVTVEGLR